MKLQEIQKMTCEKCAKFCDFEFGYTDVDIARNDVLRKCHEAGIFEPVIDNETVHLLASIVPAANELGIGDAWQKMLESQTMKSLSLAGDAANAVAVDAEYMSTKQVLARNVSNAATVAYQASRPRWFVSDASKAKKLLRNIVKIIMGPNPVA